MKQLPGLKKRGTVRRANPQPSQVGSASVLVLACAGVMMFLALVLATAGAMVIAHRRAQAAADLTALAAASQGCEMAASVATHNGASLVSCAGGSRSALVRVEVAGPGWLGTSYTFQAEARAGPASAEVP